MPPIRSSRSGPTEAEAEEQLDEAVIKIQRAMPKAQIVRGPNSVQGIMGIIDETRARFRREQTMLMEVARSISNPTPKKRRAERIRKLFEIADKHNIPRTAISVFCVVSSIAVENRKSPAAKLLKMNTTYTAKDAYNALCDLRALDLTLQGAARFPDENLFLCTADRNLALLWCGLQTVSSMTEDGHVAVSFDPIDELLPESTKGVWRAGIDEMVR